MKETMIDPGLIPGLEMEARQLVRFTVECVNVD